MDVTIKQRTCGGALFDPIVMTGIILPNGQTYGFKYDEFGEITKITYPSGAYERFEYQGVTPLGAASDLIYSQTNRGVHKRFVSVDGATESQVWTYEQLNVDSHYAIRTTAPDGSSTEQLLANSAQSYWGFEDPRAGMPIEQRSYDASSDHKLRSRTLNEWLVEETPVGGILGVAKRDPRPVRTISITFENDQPLAIMKETAYETPGESASTAPTDPTYFARLNAKQARSYHFLPLTTGEATAGYETAIANLKNKFYSQGQLAGISQTDYSYDTNYRARGIIGLPTEMRVLNPTNLSDILGKSQTVYDEGGAYPIISAGTDAMWQDPGSNLRGNATTTKTWVKDSNTWLFAHAQYDNFGNLRKAWDVSGDTGKFVETQYSSTYKYAYPTSVTVPAPDPANSGHGTTDTSTVSTTYDLTTGLPLSVTDDFGQVATTEYNDVLLRPTKVNPVVVNGAPTGPVSETIYDDVNRTVTIRKQLDATNWDEATTYVDGLGRTIKTVAKDAQGDVTVETHYDNMGRVDRVTSPYRSGDTVYWSKTRYDEMGRAVETYAPEPLATIGNAASLGVTSFDVSIVSGFVGTVVVTTDASGRKGRSITNALGQLVRVDEPTSVNAVADSGGIGGPGGGGGFPGGGGFGGGNTGGGGDGVEIGDGDSVIVVGGGGGGGGGAPLGGGGDPDLGSLAAPFQPTYYTYSPQGKMIQVTQGAQNRYFKYDSLGRLIHVRQPEQEINPGLSLSDTYNISGGWTAGFTYDVLGNVLTATDAKGTVITNTYDRANRATTRTYSNEPTGITTPGVNFYYDGKGLASQQSPNFAKGKLTKITSSVSETQNTLFDNFGRLTETKQITDGNTYTSSYIYNLSGALVQETYPSGRVVHNEFATDGDLANVTSKRAGSNTYGTYVSDFSYTASGGISQMKLGNGLWETAQFNSRMQVTQLGLGSSATDTGLWRVNYEYGELDLSGNTDTTKNTGNIAKQTLTIPGTSFTQAYRYDPLYRLTEAKETAGTTQNWIQQFGYDQYGNRLSIYQQKGGTSLTSTPSVDGNSNRFTAGQGFVYDKNGNIAQDIDPVTSHARQFVFNGDNKQTQVNDVSTSQSVGTYYYDGEGKRVKKVTDTETTIFVYSSGKLVAEYSTQLAAQPAVSYTTTDHLGTPRVVTDQLGNVKARRDFMPFGEELFANIGARSSALNYSSSSDTVRQKFTGYQKDTETSLDFAEARMYENRFGRFTAIDPLLASGKSANPQTFNRFVYVGNNPIIATDPFGLDWYFNSELNRYDWSDDGKKFYYSKLDVGKGWEKVGGNFLYPIKNSDSFISLDQFSHHYDLVSQLEVLEGLSSGVTGLRMSGFTSYSPGVPG